MLEEPRDAAMKMVLAAAVGIALSAVAARGQAINDAPQFEVASVKPAVAPDLGRFAFILWPAVANIGFEGGPGSKDPGTINYHEVTLKSLLARAHGFKPDQISGPGWLGSEHDTIQATLPPDTDRDRLRLMLQRLLAERFQMRLHTAIQEQLGLTLESAREPMEILMIDTAEKVPTAN